MVRLFIESLEFISHNTNVTTNQIPEHLLRYWAISKDFDEYFKREPARYEFYLFKLALDKYYGTEGKKNTEKSYSELIQLFEDFQTIIGFAIADRDAQYPIFDFNNYNKLMKSI